MNMNENDSRYLVSTFIIERQTDPVVRHFIFGMAEPVDLDSYLDFTPSDETRFPLMGIGNREDWVPTTLVRINQVISHQELQDIRKNLQSGQFALPGNAHADLVQATQKIFPRPKVIQLDENSASNIRNNPPPASKFGHPVYVESFWLMDKVKSLIKALDPTADEMAGTNTDTEEQRTVYAQQAADELENRIIKLLSQLTTQTRLAFQKTYMERLFNIEIHVPIIPIEGPAYPTHVEVMVKRASHEKSSARGVTIFRHKSIGTSDLLIDVTLMNNHELVYSRLLLIPASEKNESISAIGEEEISEFEVRIFRPDRDSYQLIDAEHCILLRTTTFDMHVARDLKVYKDKLSERLINQKMSSGHKLQKATSFSSMKFSAGGHGLDPWVGEAQSVRRFVEQLTPQASKSRWFPHGLGQEGEALLYLGELIDDSKNSEIYVVDPYFDITAFERVVPRVKNSEVKLTILTCCFGQALNTDNSSSPKGTIEAKKKKQRDGLRAWCTRHSAFISCGLSIVDLTSGNDQAFHDRYLALKDTSGEIRAFSLSSSINKYAGRFPCMIIELEPAMAKRVFAYIVGLANGMDMGVADGTEPKKLNKTVIWDSRDHHKKRIKGMDWTQQFVFEAGPVAFPFWKQAISWLLNLTGLEDRDAVDQAMKSGFFYQNSFRWKRPDAIDSLLVGAASNPPDSPQELATFLCGLGSLEYNSAGGNRILDSASRHLLSILNQTAASALLDAAAELYLDLPQPMGLKDFTITCQTEGIGQLVQSRERPSFDMVSNASRLLGQPFGLVPQKWTPQLCCHGSARKDKPFVIDRTQVTI